MEAHDDHIVELITRFKSGMATPEEIRELETWYASFDDADKYTPRLTDGDRIRLKGKNFHKIMRQVVHEPTAKYTPMTYRRLRNVTIGLVLVTFALGGYFFWQSRTPVDTIQSVVDAMPGGNRAILTLGDGRQIDLDGVNSGYLTVDNGMRITKSADGEILYESHSGQEAADDEGTDSQYPVYNTITTPSGGQYTIVLPDGTTVWMNSASSLRYPTRFFGPTRVVELQGEAYFAVKPMDSGLGSLKIPFIVRTSNYDVEVTGTEFNVNAYPDEASANTTLVSGSVDIVFAVGDDSKRVTLRPSQQASIGKGKINVEQVDVMTATAWKDGFFYFNDTDLYTLVRQFARWYNVEVEYAAGIKNDVFFGKIPRQYTLSEAMQVLELGDVHFKIVHDSDASESERKRLILEP